MKPLEGVTVLDFSQFLAGPSVGLRLADLGANVIKIEKPGTGDICREMYVSNLVIDGDSSIFHAINRNKDAIEIDLTSEKGRKQLKPLLQKADAMIINFRLGVAEKLLLDYESISKINREIVYGEITGYGYEGPWKTMPGQDLLVQSLSGLCWLNGNAAQPPVPFGLSIADMFTGQHLVQGMLAGLIQKQISGEGVLVQCSLLESVMDIQFELFTTYLNDGHELPVRSSINNANAYISAPYGIYETQDGYLAIAMVPIPLLGDLISCEPLKSYDDPTMWAVKRDEIKQILVQHLKTQTTAAWLDVLEAADIWCADVMTWKRLFETEGFKGLNMIQTVKRQSGVELETTRCPISIDREIFTSDKAAPVIGQDNAKYLL